MSPERRGAPASEPGGYAFRVHGTSARVDRELALLQARYREAGMEVVVERVMDTMALVVAPKSPWEVL